MLEDERRRSREGAERERLEVPRTSKAPAPSEGDERTERRREIQTAAPSADRPLHSVGMKRSLVALMADQTARQVDSSAERGFFVMDARAGAGG